MGKQSSFDDHYDVIKQLYVVEGRKLSEVMEIMKERGFERSKASYEGYLRKWGFRKNADWKVLEGPIEKRRDSGKQTVVDVNAFRRRGKAWVDRNSARRFIDTWNKLKKRREESTADCLARAGHSMVIRSPSPPFEFAFRKDPIPLWFQFQDLLRAKGIPTRLAVLAGTSYGTSEFSNTGSVGTIKQTLGLFKLLAQYNLELTSSNATAGLDMGILQTRVVTLWAEEVIPSMIPERYQNEHRHMAEVLCRHSLDAFGCPEYLMLQLFRLGNNLFSRQHAQSLRDARNLELMREFGKLWPGSIKALLSSNDWLVQGIKEKLFRSAVRRGDLEILELILESGFGANTVITDPEHWMLKWNNPAIVVAVAGRDEQTSLSVIRLLVTYGATSTSQSVALERALLTGRRLLVTSLMETRAIEVNIDRLLQAIRPGRSDLRLEGYDALWMIEMLVDGGIGKAHICSILTAIIGLGSLRTFSVMRTHLISGASQWNELVSLAEVEFTNAEVAEILRATPTGGCMDILAEAILAGCTDIVRMIITARYDTGRRITIRKDSRLLKPFEIDMTGLESIVPITPLGLAAGNENTEIAEYLIAREAVDGAVLNILLRSGGGFSITALGLAAFRGHSSMIDLLLTQLSCPMPNSHASLPKLQVLSPLLWACHQGHAEISMKLLDAGLDVNEGDTFAREVGRLHCRCRNVRTYDKPLGSLIEVLICRFRDSDEVHKNLFHRLIRQGARVEEGLLEAARAHQHPALVAILSAHYYNTLAEMHGQNATCTRRTALEFAIEFGPVKLVKKLVSLDGLAGISQINHIHRLETAKFLDQIGLVPALLASNGTQILTSVILSAPRVTQYLLRYKINLDDRCSPVRRRGAFDANSSTFSAPLDAAVFTGQLDLVRNFLERGAIITADTWGCVFSKKERAADILGVMLRFWSRCADHVTPELAKSPGGGGVLLDAATLGDRRSVELLLENGPVCDEQCLGIALAGAVFCGKYHLVQLFLDAGASLEEQVPPSLREGIDGCCGDCPLLSAVVHNDKDVVRMLIRAGARVDDITGYKALYIAQKSSHGMEVVDILLEGGAKPDNNQGSLWGPTPLQMAAYTANYPLMLKLIEHGANVDAPPYNNDYYCVKLEEESHVDEVLEGSNGTALQFAVIEGHFQMVRLLIEKGANVNAPGGGPNGRTALEAAAEHGRLEILHMLLSGEPKVDISGPSRLQFLRAVRLAEKEGHMAAAGLLRHHGGWSVSDARESVENPRVVHAGCNNGVPGGCQCDIESTDIEMEETGREGRNFAGSEGTNDIPRRGSQHREDPDQESDICQPEEVRLDGYQNASIHTQIVAPDVEMEDYFDMTPVAIQDPRQDYQGVLNTGPGHPPWERDRSMFSEFSLQNENDGITGVVDTNMEDIVDNFPFGEFINWPSSPHDAGEEDYNIGF